MDYLRFFGVAPRLNPRCILLGGFHFVSKPISYCERVNHFTQLETGWRAVAGSWPWTDRGSGVAAGNPYPKLIPGRVWTVRVPCPRLWIFLRRTADADGTRPWTVRGLG